MRVSPESWNQEIPDGVIAAPRYGLPGPRPLSVRHYVAGGRENGGGIGRLVGYIVDTADPLRAAHRVTDTRGPRWFAPTSLPRLALAMLAMAKDRVLTPDRIHHIHVAGRGSTSRKLLLAAAARLLGCMHVLHLHDYDYAADFLAGTSVRQARVRAMFQGADNVVALGERDRATLQTLLGVDGRRIVVAHNCVPDPGQRPARQTGPVSIVFLGRLSERKGVPELLDALAHPAMVGLEWRAVLAGDGPVETYRAQAAALGLANRVEMPGWLDGERAKDLCRLADILVLPSHAEGMAMAVIEGLAHGLGVVTTRVGAHEEAIVDGENGLFVPVGDVGALATTLADLITDPARREGLSAAARLSYLSRFSMAAYQRRLQTFYEAISRKDKARVHAQ